MFAQILLQNFLIKSLSHKGKLTSILESTRGLIFGNRLTIAGLGRNLKNGNKTKSNINKIARLIGSMHFHQERDSLFRHHNEKILKGIKRPVIAVDWSDTAVTSTERILCATICLSGRGIVCYEKVYSGQLYNSRKAHKDFIEGLWKVLPLGCAPIILTDAASSFGIYWFELINAKGWTWIGRVRLGNKYFYINDDEFSVNELYKQAVSKGRHHKECGFTKEHKFLCNLTVIKGKTRRKNSNNNYYVTRRSHRHGTSKHKRRGNEPWILISSTNLKLTKNQIIELYSARMTIEERFRDTKDANFGSGLLLSRSKGAMRIENLLMIDVLAKFVLWAIGCLAEKKGLAKEFQANTIQNRRVLSIIRLAREVILRNDRIKVPIQKSEIGVAMSSIRAMVLCIA